MTDQEATGHSSKINREKDSLSLKDPASPSDVQNEDTGTTQLNGDDTPPYEDTFNVYPSSPLRLQLLSDDDDDGRKGDDEERRES